MMREKWLPSEDELLREIVPSYGPSVDWQEVAVEIPMHSGKWHFLLLICIRMYLFINLYKYHCPLNLLIQHD